MRFIPRSLIVIAAFVFFPIMAKAQQAIVNMPSADITPKGRYFLMHETQWRPWNSGRYWYGTNFFTYGVGKNTELALTTYNSGTPRALNENIGVGFKTAVPLFKKSRPEREIKWTFGQMTTLNTRGKGVGTFLYTHGSFVLPKFKTRLTAGVSGGTTALFKANTVHAIASFEHPVIEHKFYVLGEWFSGRHDFGFFIPGILYHPKKDHIIVVAYKLANTPANGKNGLVMEYGFFFGGNKEAAGHDPHDPHHPLPPEAALKKIQVEEREEAARRHRATEPPGDVTMKLQGATHPTSGNPTRKMDDK